jgi:hypothetical protein
LLLSQKYTMRDDENYRSSLPFSFYVTTTLQEMKPSYSRSIGEKEQRGAPSSSENLVITDAPYLGP